MLPLFKILPLAALTLTAITSSYVIGNMRGHSAGKAKVEAVYTQRDNDQLAKVNNRLNEIQEENNAQWKRWIETNERLVSTVADKIENKTTTIREIPVEKLVEVASDCSIGYGVIGVLNDTASATNAD